MPVAFDFSHQDHALVTLYVQFLCSDWSKFDRWVHAENLCSILKLAYFDSWSWQSFVSTCDVFNCLFLLDVQNEIRLLSRVFFLQNFKKPLDIFSPKIERRAFQRIFCYNSGCERKLWAIFLPQVHLRRHSNGTRSLTHSLTHSILINLFIKVKLNTLLLPPLLSITFVPSAF